MSEHPLIVAVIQLGLAAILAYFLTERWQRWRQRREFQFRALVKLGELSEEAFSRLSELLGARDRIAAERQHQLRREHLYRRGPLFAMDGEISTAFKDPAVLQDLIELTKVMRILFQMACAPNRTPVEQFKPVQDCMAARRRLMMARMAREMRYFSKSEFREALEKFGPKAELPPGIALPPGEEGAE